MAEPDPQTRAAAIDAFAAVLRDLRESAGTPSFREMSGRSGAISHTTLHDAAQGHRMPSWATTVEFVNACGGDPADFREHWEQARQVCHGADPEPAAADTESDAESGAKSDPEPDREPDASGPADADGPHELMPHHPIGPHGNRRLIVAAAGVAAVVIAGIAMAVAANDGSGDPAAGPKSSADTSSDPSSVRELARKDCPIQQTNPPSAAPRHAGDKSVFITDVTLPDCRTVAQASRNTKTWRIKNVGSRTWRGYKLHRMDPQGPTGCRTALDTPIRTTAPGQTVDISVDVVAPTTPTFCFVRFKMLDASNHVVFPASRPVNLQLIVE